MMAEITVLAATRIADEAFDEMASLSQSTASENKIALPGQGATAGSGVVDKDQVLFRVNKGVDKLQTLFGPSLHLALAAVAGYDKNRRKMNRLGERIKVSVKALERLQQDIEIHKAHLVSIAQQLRPLTDELIDELQCTPAKNMPLTIKDPCLVYHLYRDKSELQLMESNAARMARRLVRMNEAVPKLTQKNDKILAIAKYETKRHQLVHAQCSRVVMGLNAFVSQFDDLDEKVFICVDKLGQSLAAHKTPFESLIVDYAPEKMEYTHTTRVCASYTADQECPYELDVVEGEMVSIAEYNGNFDSRTAWGQWYNIHKESGEEGIAPARNFTMWHQPFDEGRRTDARVQNFDRNVEKNVAS